MSWNNSAIENVKKIGVKSLNKTVEVVLNKYVDPVTPHDFGELEKGNLFSLEMFTNWQSKEAMALIYPYTTKTAETGSRAYNEVWRSDVWD